MRIIKFVLPVGALAMGALMLAPTESHGFTLLGGKLGVELQRDVRVFNNFTDPEANNNTTPDPNWPGYTGAPLAIWKACSEWGSELHNLNGLGDPQLINLVGSGGANFDITWQGLATTWGGTDDNIHSEIGGNGGGTYAFTESPINDGWRIRYYKEPWVWQDGPDNNGATDLQSIATHEYGHALGLDHTSVAFATMQPSTSGGTGQRSIEPDDQAGVQFLYGVIDLTKKPHIETVQQAGGILTLTGTQFDTSGQNEVWFTQAGVGGTGTAVKVTGINSNGTTLSCAIPAAAGPGDIVVRKASVTGPKGMSNQMAFEPAGGACTGAVTTYCTAGTTASGCQAMISGTGTPSATSGSGFTIDVAAVEGDKDGLIFFGENGRQANFWGNGTSFQCVVPPVKRTGLQTAVGTPGACDGAFSLDFNAYVQANPQKNPGGGALVQAQAWFRDPLNTSNQTTSLSDALEFVLCP